MNDNIFDGSKESDGNCRWPLIRFQDILVSPKSARLAYDKYQFRRQREISNAHVEKYAEAMSAGTFKPGTTITIAESCGSKWLVDGNHTLLAVERYGQPFPLRIEYRLVNDEADAAVLYSTFEARKRTLAAHMAAAGLDEKTGVSPSMLARFATGLNMLELGFPQKVPRLVDNAARQQLIARWSENCKAVEQILAGAHFNKILVTRSAAVAMMFLTVKHVPDTAIAFWSAIAHNKDLAPGTAQHTAFLELNKSAKVTTAAEQFAALALAWNAYYDNKPISFLRVFCGPIRVTVKGTPWANRLTGTVKTERRK